ncbi:MAG: flagellar basal body rod protein FlgB [Clostridiales bacterium]|jgi:flagellar basal-body rod protein FlgB|nr:flagellar basal body rod protein FlgB [Clostridiales bacterium]
MSFNSIFNHNELIGTALQAASVRNLVINNNLANNDVPGFKKNVVSFEELLEDELQSAELTGQVNLDRLTPRVVPSLENYSYRLDGNNVNIETEMVELYKNASKYDVMAQSVINNYRRINLVITGR